MDSGGMRLSNQFRLIQTKDYTNDIYTNVKPTTHGGPYSKLPIELQDKVH